MVVDIKQHKSQFTNSNITITQCQKNFADCVMVKFEFLNCDLCCFISKKAFYRSFNAIFGRTGRLASEEVVLHLIKVKCLPVLLYGIKVCPVNLSDMRSLEFTVRRVLIKLFDTYNCAIIDSCMSLFGLSVSELAGQRVHRFLFKFNMLDNILCKVCQYRA